MASTLKTAGPPCAGPWAERGLGNLEGSNGSVKCAFLGFAPHFGVPASYYHLFGSPGVKCLKLATSLLRDSLSGHAPM